MTGVLTLRRLALAAVLLTGLAVAGSYAHRAYEQEQAWESLLQDCSDCGNRHAGRLRFQAWQAEQARDLAPPARLAQDSK